MAKQFEEKQFNIPDLKGISNQTVEEHLKLYTGYVKNANLILAKVDEYSEDASPLVGAGEEHAYALSEIQRRFGFEFDGLRNHEYYFAHLENGSTPLTASSPLHKAIEEGWGTYDRWFARFKKMAMTRGVGWAVLYYDKHTDQLLNSWIDEQHLGHLTGLSPILMLDMWEHSFVADYQPSGKKQYVEDFFTNLNWQSCEKNLEEAKS
ncbi:Fe-Mn family superoxide dismutase [Candidatus Parcubacteria bacterium]|nr:Fe-Mn family superoxide dismutase [Candidatus Parcubacteria bacterium]